MMGFMLSTFKATLEDLGFDQAIRNIQFGLSHSSYHLFSVLEMYNPSLNIFITPVCELGFALYKMFEVCLISMGELPYEEYVPITKQMNRLKSCHVGMKLIKR